MTLRTLRAALLVVTISFGLLAAGPGTPDPGDLTVGWISRTPAMEFVRDSANPAREGWPAEGQMVTWRAHVKNFSSVARANVSYRWSVDGVPIAASAVSLPANAYTTLELPWQWTFRRHRLHFAIDTSNAVPEEEEGNNDLTIFTDALSVGFYVERSHYDFFRAHQHRLGVGSSSWENWAQRHIARFNEMAAIAIYPETPHGVLDRWRIDAIHVVPDGALPLVPVPDPHLGRDATNAERKPNLDDRTVDMQWGFVATSISHFSDLTSVSNGNPFYYDGTVLHELGHARYLTDLYAWDVRHQAEGDSIDILEEGKPVAATPLMPQLGAYVHWTPIRGLMNRQFTYIDVYSAINMNQIAGQRPLRGNYNDPAIIGDFINDLPQQNRLTIRNHEGTLLADADVRIYRSTGDGEHWYARRFDNTPDMELRTDGAGQALVGRSPFSADGRIVHTFGESNGVVIVRVQTDAGVWYGFLESTAFNLAYWRGDTDFAEHELVVGPTPCGFSWPQLVEPAITASGLTKPVTLRWTATPGATGYRVFASVNGHRPIAIGRTTVLSLSTPVAGTVLWWVEAELAHCPFMRSATGRFSTVGATRQRPARQAPATGPVNATRTPEPAW